MLFAVPIANFLPFKHQMNLLREFSRKHFNSIVYRFAAGIVETSYQFVLFISSDYLEYIILATFLFKIRYVISLNFVVNVAISLR